MFANAGCVVETETPHLLDNADRPADVLVKDFEEGKDVVIDVTVYNNRSTKISDRELLRRIRGTGRAARQAERIKRDKRGGANNQRMEDRVKARGMKFLPLGFENDGATGASWAALIKKLSEVAHDRRGHDKLFFRRRWTADIAMTLAKRGVQVLLKRLRASRGSKRARADAAAEGPLCHRGAEDPLWLGEF